MNHKQIKVLILSFIILVVFILFASMNSSLFFPLYDGMPLENYDGRVISRTLIVLFSAHSIFKVCFYILGQLKQNEK